MKSKFPDPHKFFLTASILVLVALLGFSAFFYLSGWNDRLLGSIQVFPDPAKPYTMPAFSTVQDLLHAASIAPGDDQLIFVNGQLMDPRSTLPQNAVVEIRSYHSVWIAIDGVRQPFQTFSPTVGTVLEEVGIPLSPEDSIDPSLDSYLSNGLTINVRHARPVILQVNGKTLNFTSAESSPHAILASLGFTPIGADVVENEFLQDGTMVIRLKTANETIAFKALYDPFKTVQKYSADLPRGETQITQEGSPGVTLTTIRDLQRGNTDRELTIGPQIVAEPIDQIVLTSNQSGVFSLETDAGELEYWKVLEMYTTSYSPCNSGTDHCLPGTSSGLPAGYGVVAVVPSVFNALNGTQVYVPGYGFGVIGDIGGGFPDGRPWIDLGYDDSNYTGWYGYHTVYFLGPPPAYDPF